MPVARDRLEDHVRVAAVRSTGLLDTVPEEAFDRYARLARRALGADQAVINVVDAERQFTKACVAAAPDSPIGAGTSLPAEESFCARVVAADAPIVAPDTRRDPVLSVVPGPGLDVVGGYAGLPLHDPSGEAVGTLCAMSSEPRAWSADDLATLDEVRDGVETEIALRVALAESDRRTLELEERARGIELLHEALVASGEDWVSTRTAMTRAAAAAAHELRTPLAALRNLAEDLHADAPEELRHDVDTVRETAEEALRLVNEQLDLSRGVAPRASVRPAPVDVPRMLRSLRGMMLPLVAGKPLHLTFAAHDVETIRTDGRRLAQVLRNLMANAVRICPAGEIRLTVRRDRDDPDWVRFEVADEGPGIDPLDQERIFEAFEQVGAHAAGGTGLGLAISRAFAELLGGTLTVESAPGRGARFLLRVPAELPSAD